MGEIIDDSYDYSVKVTLVIIVLIIIYIIKKG
jgi:hypothetical protein